MRSPITLGVSLLCALIAASCEAEPEPGVDVPTGNGGDAARADGHGNSSDVVQSVVDVPDPPRQTCRVDGDCTMGPMCSLGRCGPGGICSYSRDLARCECDPNCHSESAMGAAGWSDPGRNGVEYDPDSNGLIVRAEARRGDYLWVPNSGESTFSKWDANTGVEIAKYRVGIAGNDANNSPSRVVVDGHGDAFVATRGIGIIGTVTKVAADLRDCVDRNMNGMIDTSQNRTNVLPLGQDECVLWSTQVGVPNGLLRALAIGPGTEDEPGGSVWAGICGSTTGQWRLHSRTGAIVRNFNIPRCTYGAVATRDGNIWFHTPSGGVTPINSADNTIGEYRPIAEAPAECRSSYGITADANNRLWFSRSGNGVAGYDPATRQWTCMQATNVAGGRAGAIGSGITVDATNRVWGPQAGSPLMFYVWDANAFTPGGMIPPAMIRTYSLGRAFGSSALGADRAGRMWVVQGNELVRFDPMGGGQTTMPGPVGVYSYTDFTGAVRRLVLREGSYTQDYHRCAMGHFTQLNWSADVPGDARLIFQVRTAATAMGLDAAPAITVATLPGAMPPVDIAAAIAGAGMTEGEYLRVTVQFRPGMATPVLRTLSVEHRCMTMDPG